VLRGLFEWSFYIWALYYSLLKISNRTTISGFWFCKFLNLQVLLLNCYHRCFGRMAFTMASCEQQSFMRVHINSLHRIGESDCIGISRQCSNEIWKDERRRDQKKKSSRTRGIQVTRSQAFRQKRHRRLQIPSSRD
jgi:hypothetical protein